MAESESIGKIGLDLVVNDKQFSRQLSGITGIAKKAGTALAAAFGVKKLINFGKECLNLGSDLEEVQNVVDSTFTKMSSKVDKFAKDAMTSYGLSETMAKRYSGTLGAMAKAFGFSEKEAYDMGTTLTGLAGDVASFYNISQDEAYTKIKSVFTGETESLKDLGVVMTQTALDSYALANGFGKTTSAMTEAEKVALRFKFVQDQLTTAAGDFARTSNSWANQVRILSLQFDSFKASIGQGLINVLTPAIQWINVLMSRLVALGNAFKSFTELFTGKNKAAEGAKSIAESYQSAAKASDAMASSGTKAANKVSKAAQKAAKKVRSLMGFDQINKVSDNEQTTGSDGGNSGTTGTGGASAGASLDLDTGGSEVKLKTLPKLYENLSTSIERFKKSCSGLSNVLSSGMKWAYDNVLKPLGEWTISKLVPKILDLFSAALDVLTETIKALQPLGTWLWDKLFSKLANFAGDVIIKFLDLLTTGLEKLSDWISKHQTTVQNIAIVIGSFFVAFKAVTFITTAITVIKKLGTVLTTIKTLFTAIPAALSLLSNPVVLAVTVIGGLIAAGILLWKNWDKIKAKLKKFANYFKKEWNNLKKSVKKDIEIITGAIDKLKEAPEKIKEWFGEKLEDVEEWFSGIKESFDNALEGLGENLPDLSEVGEKITEAVGEVEAKITGYFADKKEALTKKWNELTANVKEKVADLKAKVASKWSDLQTAWGNIVNNVKEKTADMKAKIASTWANLRGNWEAITNNIKGKTAEMAAKVVSKAKAVKKEWDEVADKWKDKKAEFSLKFSAAASDLKKWVNTNVIDKVNGKFKKVPILKNHLIPRLAQGGYVAKNTPQLAMIGDNRHQGEVVAPEDKLEAMALQAAQMAAGGGNTEIISLLRQILAAILALSLTVNLDGKDITSNVIKRINDITKSTGKTPIIV